MKTLPEKKIDLFSVRKTLQALRVTERRYYVTYINFMLIDRCAA